MADPRELNEFLNWQPVPLEPIVSDGIFFEGSKALLYGKYGSLKTMLGIRFALAVSLGIQWLGFNTVSRSVLYLQLEIVEPMLQERVKAMVAKTTVGVNRNGNSHQKLWFWTEKLKIDTQEGWDLLSKWVTELEPQVLIIDPLYSVVSGDLTSTVHIQKLTDWLDTLMAKHGLSVMLVHHSKKGSGVDEWGSDNMLGSSILNNWADTIIEIKRDSYSQVLLTFQKLRHAKKELKPRYYEWDENNADFISSTRMI